MNLIEIANQLKSAPDQFLIKEIQNPSGNYPAYLVLSEMNRRENMRKSLDKEAPTTTVAEDLAAQSRVPQISQQPAVQPPQAGQLSSAGIMQTPQAMQEIAAQDAMASQPVRMAGGGLVAFDEGGVVRGQDGLFVDPNLYSPPGPVRGIIPSITDIFRPTQESIGTAEERERQRLREEQLRELEFRRIMSQGPTQTSPVPATSAGSTTAPAASVAPVTPFASPYGFDIRNRLADVSRGAGQIENIQLKSPEQLDVERKAGITAYEADAPFRFGFLQEDIERRKQDVSKRRSSNINEALIEAGLRIGASRSPRFLGALGEGGLGALKSYKEGLSDIRKAEEAITQSKVQFAQAQSLYDQNKISAGDKALQRAVDNENRGINLASTKQAARVQAISPFIQAEQEARAQFLLPQQADVLRAQADYYRTAKGSRADTTPSPSEIKAAEELADKRVLERSTSDKNFKLMSPEAQAYKQSLIQFYLAQGGKFYNPPSLTPQPISFSQMQR